MLKSDQLLAGRGRKLSLAAVIFVLLLAVAVCWGKTRQAGADDPATGNRAGGPPPGLPVETALVISGPADREISAVGSLRADEAVIVASEIAGRVAEIFFAEGDAVVPGQLLFRLDQGMAIAEQERSLSAGRWLADQATARKQAAATASEAAELSGKRYRAGRVSYLEVVESERTALAAERAVIQIQNQRLQAMISLIKALGGGW